MHKCGITMGGEIGSRSELNLMVGEKQSSAQFGEKLERCKRAKVHDLDSVCHSQEMAESNRHFLSMDEEKSREFPRGDANATNFAQAKIMSKMLPSFDLNADIRESNNPASIDQGVTSNKSKGFGWDLNAEHKSNSPNEDPFLFLNNRENLKMGDVSECGSTTGPLENKDPMKVWKEMKQNGFLSSSHMSMSLPKQRGRKSKNDSLKKKMELAKKEQVDRFAKIAAPSGLLNELNPGIINHVRNRKQVHSIIEALVRLEKKENQQGVGKQGFPQVGSLSTSSMSQQTGGSSLHLGVDESRKEGDPKVERWYFDKNSCPLSKKQVGEDDVLALKLVSSTAMGSEDISSLSNVESSNFGTISSLSVKAANVAFHWLELLHQDINGRLLALRRSKQRVRSVISTELPFLMSREFSVTQENDPYIATNIADICSLGENADTHRAKWSALFDQMDKSLSEEEKQLENWLHQVIEMQLQCEKGLRSHPLHVSQRPGTSETDHRLEEEDKSERELAVRAAAASIYSTCNFLSSSENLPCF